MAESAESAGSTPFNQQVAVVKPWYQEVTVYHWLVLILAACGWLFDCMGQRIFVLAREPALRELLGATATDGDVKYWGGMATMHPDDRLGHGRHSVRHDERQVRPGQGHGRHPAGVHDLRRPVRPGPQRHRSS